MAEEKPESSSRRRWSLTPASELPCSLVDVTFLVGRVVVEVVEVVIVVVVLFLVFVLVVVLVVVEIVIPVGELETAVLAKDELAPAFRTAHGITLLEVIRVDLFVVAVRAGRHIGTSSIESATSRRRGIISRSTRPRQ